MGPLKADSTAPFPSAANPGIAITILRWSQAQNWACDCIEKELCMSRTEDKIVRRHLLWEVSAEFYFLPSPFLQFLNFPP